MNKNDKKKLALTEIVLIVIGTIGLLVVIWLAWLGPERASQAVRDYEACSAQEGSTLQMSAPPVCVTRDGKRYVGPK